MSHLKNRGRNRWQICLDLGEDPSTGKRQRKYKTVKGTKAEAEAVMAEMLGQSHRGFEPQDMTLAQYIDEWLEGKKNDIEKSTAMTYKNSLKTVLDDIGRIKLKHLRPHHIKKAMDDCVERGNGKSAMRHKKTVLSSALHDAVHIYKYLPENPAANIPIPKKVPARKRDIIFLEKEDALDFIDKLDMQHLRYICHISLHTGMRLGEVLGLEWKNVNIFKKEIRICQSLAHSNKELYIKGVKNDEERTVPIWDEFASFLERIRLQRKKERIFFGEAYSNNDLVVCKADGYYFHPKYTSNTFKPRADKYCPGLTIHSFRHTFASILLKKGVDMKMIQELLGHKDFSMTSDIYSHILPSSKDDLRDKMADIFR